MGRLSFLNINSIRTKITAGIIILNIIILCIVNIVIDGFVKDIARESAIKHVQAAIIAYHRYEDQKERFLIKTVQSLSQVSFLKATMTIEDVDAKTIGFTSQQLAADTAIEKLFIFNASGNLKASTYPDVKPHELKSWAPYITQSLEGHAQYFITSLDYSPFRAGLSPIFVGSEIVGIIGIVETMNVPEEIAFAQEITNSNIITTYGNLNNFQQYSQDQQDILKVLYDNQLPAMSKRADFAPVGNRDMDQNYKIISVAGINIIATMISEPGIDGHQILYTKIDTIKSNVEPISLILLICSLVALLFSALSSHWVALKISHPIESLRKTAHQFSKGRFDVRSNINTKDEIGQLSQAFNQMADNIGKQRSKLIDKESAEKEMRRLAYYDSLTGLPNRRYFKEEIFLRLKLIKEMGKGEMAVMFIDVDNFKQVNDSLGHDIGDELLVHFSKSLQSCTREKDLVARSGHNSDEVPNSGYVSRLGGDEFTIVIFSREGNMRKATELISNRILNLFIKPLQLNGHAVKVGASIGIAIAPQHGTDTEELLKHADKAMYLTKQQGKNNFQYYDSESCFSSQQYLEAEKEILHALSTDELVVYYQPIVDAHTLDIIDAEALIRWQHPIKGLIPPDTFLPIIEQMGMMGALFHTVCSEVCQKLAKWKQQHNFPGRIHINVSGSQFSDESCYQILTEILKRFGIDGNQIGIELTETVFVKDFYSARNTIYLLKSIGVHIAIDDFGTGFSCLKYLTELPLDTLKIDKCFIKKGNQTRQNNIVVKNILHLANLMNLEVIAEGIEEKDQLAYIKQRKVKKAQGYLFYKPMPVDEFESLLSSTV